MTGVAENDASREARPISTSALAMLGAVFAFAAAGAWLGRDLAARAIELAADGVPENPYWLPDHAVLLYARLPLAFLANLTLWWGPGICLALAFTRPRRWTELLLVGFVLAWFVQLGVGMVGRHVVGTPLDGGGHAVLAVAALGLCWGVLAMRRHMGRALVSGIESRGREALTLATTLLIPVAALVGFLPVLLWQDPNADGLESLYMGWSMLTHDVPRVPNDAELLGFGTGAQGLAPMVHWRISWDGPVDFASRSAFVMLLPALFAALVELIEVAAPRRLGLVGIVGVLGAMTAYVIAMVHSAGYDSFVGDASSPAGIDTLFAVLVVALLVFVLQRRIPIFFLAFLIAVVTRPTIALVLVGFVGGTVLFFRGSFWSAAWRTVAALGLAVGLEWLHSKYAVTATGGDVALGSDSIRSRLRFVTLTDFGRVLYMAIPCGLLPVAALVLIKKQDAITRCLALTALGYFVFFYAPSFVALHHFVPAMVLPVVVFWRMNLHATSGRATAWALASLVACAAAIWLALPDDREVSTGLRRIGRTIVLDAEPDDLRSMFAASPALAERISTDLDYDEHTRVAVAASLLRHCPRGMAAVGSRTRYVIRADGSAIPPGWRLDGRTAGWMRLTREGTFVPGIEVHSREWMARWLAVPREVLFRPIGEAKKAYDIDLKTWVGN